MNAGMTDIGYRSTLGMLLNVQCVKCGTWLAFEDRKFIDFQGGAHHCAGEPYGKVKPAELELS